MRRRSEQTAGGSSNHLLCQSTVSCSNPVINTRIDESLDQDFGGILRHVETAAGAGSSQYDTAETCADVDNWLSKMTLRFRTASRTWTCDASSDTSSVSTLANCCHDPSHITSVLVGFSLRWLALSQALTSTYDVHLELIGKRVVDFRLVFIELFFTRCYG